MGPLKGKFIALEDIDFSVDDSVLPGWNQYLAFGDGSGLSDTPPLYYEEFYEGLPPSFDYPPPADERARHKMVT